MANEEAGMQKEARKAKSKQRKTADAKEHAEAMALAYPSATSGIRRIDA